MSERRYTYKVEIDNSTLAAAEAEIQRRLSGAMAQINADPPIKRIDPRTVAGGGVNVVSIQQQERALLATHTEMEKRITADARAEAKIREAIARAEASEKTEAARTARIRVTEEERRLTAEARSQAYERSRAAALGQGGVAGAGRGMMAGLGRELSGVAMGALSVYGAIQAGQALYDAGAQGAANQQLAASFDTLTKSVGLTGASLTQKLGKALAGTVPDMRLMAETNRLLLTAQNEGITVTEKQIETLGRFSRLRATQLTANGKPLGADEAYSRLITGVTRREMELLDELSISSKGLAAQLGVDVKEVNSSVESLLTAITKVAEMELGSIGDPLLSDAEKIQKAETDITNAMDRLRVAAVKPVVFSVELVAQGLETGVGVLDGLGDAWDQARNPSTTPISQMAGNARGQMRQAQDGAMGRDVSNAEVETFRQMRESAEKYEQALDAVGRAEVMAQSRIFAGTRDIGERNAALNDLYSTLSEVSSAYVRIQELGNAGVIDPSALGQAEAEWQNIVSGIQNGNMDLGAANSHLAQMLGLLNQIAPIIGPTMAGAARGATTWADQAMQNWATNSRTNQVMAGDVAPGDLSDAERGYRLSVGDIDEKIAIYEDLTAKAKASGDTEKLYPLLATLTGLLGQKEADEQSAIDKIQDRLTNETENLADAQFRLALSTEDTTGQLALYYKQLDGLVKGSVEELNLRTQIGGLERQLANEQEAAAKRVEAEWKSAAEETARNFENALKKVPGLFSPSPVTEEDMTLSEYGLYKPKADEWLRQAEDELRNGKDYAHIDRGDIERRLAEATGFAAEKLQALPGDILADLLRGSFADHTLFADPLTGAKRNMDIIDPAAVQAAYAKQMQGERGEKNLMSMISGQGGQFGFGAGTPGNLNAFLDQLTGDDGVAAKVSAGIAEAAAPISEFGAMALAQFNESNSMAQFYQIGRVSAEETFRGWSETIGGAPFAVAMAASIKQSIIDEFREIFNGNS